MNHPYQHLQALDHQIQAKMQTLTTTHDWWPCRRGCDACCRQIAQPPALSSLEWERLDAAVAALPTAIQTAINQRLQALLSQIEAGTQNASVVCPYLDPTAAACHIYAARPIACRTYGFFVSRHDNEFCQLIAAAVADHHEAEIVWGNGAAIAHELQRLSGPAIPFAVHYGAA